MFLPAYHLPNLHLLRKWYIQLPSFIHSFGFLELPFHFHFQALSLIYSFNLYLTRKVPLRISFLNGQLLCPVHIFSTSYKWQEVDNYSNHENVQPCVLMFLQQKGYVDQVLWGFILRGLLTCLLMWFIWWMTCSGWLGTQITLLMQLANSRLNFHQYAKLMVKGSKCVRILVEVCSLLSL